MLLHRQAFNVMSSRPSVKESFTITLSTSIFTLAGSCRPKKNIYISVRLIKGIEKLFQIIAKSICWWSKGSKTPISALFIQGEQTLYIFQSFLFKNWKHKPIGRSFTGPILKQNPSQIICRWILFQLNKCIRCEWVCV